MATALTGAAPVAEEEASSGPGIPPPTGSAGRGSIVLLDGCADGRLGGISQGGRANKTDRPDDMCPPSYGPRATTLPAAPHLRIVMAHDLAPRRLGHWDRFAGGLLGACAHLRRKGPRASR